MPDVPPMPDIWTDGRHPDYCVDLPIQTDSVPRFAVPPHPRNHAGPGLCDPIDEPNCLRLLPTGLRGSQVGPKVAGHGLRLLHSEGFHLVAFLGTRVLRHAL